MSCDHLLTPQAPGNFPQKNSWSWWLKNLFMCKVNLWVLYQSLHFVNLKPGSWYLGSGWSVDHRSTGSGCESCWADWWPMRVGGTAASPPPAGSGVAARVDSCCRTGERLWRWQQGRQESAVNGKIPSVKMINFKVHYGFNINSCLTDSFGSALCPLNRRKKPGGTIFILGWSSLNLSPHRMRKATESCIASAAQPLVKRWPDRSGAT